MTKCPPISSTTLVHNLSNYPQMFTIVEAVLSTKEDDTLLVHLIRDVELLRRGEDAWTSSQTVKEDHSNPCKKRVRRSGHLGHLYKMANEIQETLEKRENRKVIADWLAEQEDPNFWLEFYNETLQVRAILCSVFLAGLRAQSN